MERAEGQSRGIAKVRYRIVVLSMFIYVICSIPGDSAWCSIFRQPKRRSILTQQSAGEIAQPTDEPLHPLTRGAIGFRAAPWESYERGP